MRILLTGGRGFIGSRIKQALLAEGHDLLSVDRKPGNGPNERTADVADPAFWETLTEEFDAVCHQAACTDTTVTDEAFMLRENLEASKRMLAWALTRGTKVVYASSAATYGNGPSPQRVGEHEEPLNVYGVSKLRFDDHVRSVLPGAPIPVVGLRYFNVYGPGEEQKGTMASMVWQLAQQMKAGKRPRIFFDGTQMRDQIFVDDIVQANLCALRAGKDASGIYNAGTGTSVSFNDIVAALNAALGTALEPEYFENPYSFYQNHTEADIAATKERLGFAPRFTLQQGVAAYAAEGAL